jgi:hypothetical protein
MTSPTSITSKLTTIELVYPPISNQEAVWVGKVPEVQFRMRESDFYMIGGRAEAKFNDIKIDVVSNELTFTLSVGSTFAQKVEINFAELPGVIAYGGGPYWVEAGEKIIRVWEGDLDERTNVLEWFTTEKLLWDRSREKPGVNGLDLYREVTIYDLLYIGIAKTGDSFERLIKNGHKARTEILANEAQRFPGARVTDETILFLFRVQPLFFRTFEPEHEFTPDDLGTDYDHKKIVVDAEKAFIKLLSPQYNNMKYSNYPKGADGLYGAGYDRYGYAIAENLAFNTARGQIRGGRDNLTQSIADPADSIYVEGNSVKLLVCGTDFPMDS